MANAWSEEITSYFCSDKLNNYDNKINEINISRINKNKNRLTTIIIILASGLLLNKIAQSINFLNFYIILDILIR